MRLRMFLHLLVAAHVLLFGVASADASLTQGGAATRRVYTDSAPGQVYVYAGGRFASGAKMSSVTFYSSFAGRYLTPMLMEETSPGVYTVRGLGSTTTSVAGVNTAPFGLKSGTDTATNGNFTWGFINSVVDAGGVQSTSSTGAVTFDYNLSEQGAGGTGTVNKWYFTPSSFGLGNSVAVGQVFSVGGWLHSGETRAYSAFLTATSTPASVTITLGNLNQTYDGSPKAATASSSPSVPLQLHYTPSSQLLTGSSVSAAWMYPTSSTVYGDGGSALVGSSVEFVNCCRPDNQTFNIDFSGNTIVVEDIRTGGPFTPATFNGLVLTVPVPLQSVSVLSSSFAGANGPWPPTAMTFDAHRIFLNFSGMNTQAGQKVILLINGNSSAPVNAGSYGVLATASDPRTAGSAYGVLTIARAAATVTLGNLNAAYDGTPKAATVTTAPAGLSVAVTYDGSATPPTAGGTYAVVATVTDPNYTGTASGTLTIQAAQASTTTLAPLNASVYGQSVTFTATVTPPATGTVTFKDGTTTLGTAALNASSVATFSTSSLTAGTHSITAVYGGDANTTPSSSGAQSLTVGKATATLVFGYMPFYDGTPKTATATTTPPGLRVTFTYDGSPNPPTAVGQYSLVGTIDDPNYEGAGYGTFSIYQGPATIRLTLASLTQTYTGAPISVTATTNPPGLGVALTYDGSATPPTAAGSYAVVASITDPNYTNYDGSGTGTLVIAKAAATVTLGNLSHTYTGSPLAATATTTPSGLAVTITYDGNTNAPTAPGSYAVVATVTDPNHTAPPASGTLTIGKAAATVMLGNLTQNYSGSPLGVTAATTPAGLAVDITYNGGSAAPSLPGTYAVAATIDSPLYQGSATGTLTINKLKGSVVNGTRYTYTGSPVQLDGDTHPVARMRVLYTWNGSSVLPSLPGTYTIGVQLDDPFYEYTGTVTIEIARAVVNIVGLHGWYGTIVYDGQPHPNPQSISTTPAGVAIVTYYNGSTTAPSEIGTYAVTFAPADPSLYELNPSNIGGRSFQIVPIPVTFTVSNITQTWDGDPKGPTITPSVAGLALNVRYTAVKTSDGSAYDSAAPPSQGGTYTVTASPADPHYGGSTTFTFTINPAVTFTFDPIAPVPFTDPVMFRAQARFSGGHAAGTVPAGSVRFGCAWFEIATSDLDSTGVATATHPGLDIGTYPCTATYVERQLTASQTLTVTKIPITRFDIVPPEATVYTGYPWRWGAIAYDADGASYMVKITYNGSTQAPVDAGAYKLVFTAEDPTHYGSVSRDVTLAPAPVTIKLNGGSLRPTYDGTPKLATAKVTLPRTCSAACAPAAGTFTYDGSSTPPVNAGSYSVVASPDNKNYTGSDSGTMVIAKATATVIVNSATVFYDGTPKSVTVTTVPAGLPVSVTYDGNTTPPSAPKFVGGVGITAYNVVATVTDRNYTGSGSGTLTIDVKTNVSITGILHDSTGPSLAVTAPYGASLTWEAFVRGEVGKGTPTGTVSIRDYTTKTVYGTAPLVAYDSYQARVPYGPLSRTIPPGTYNLEFVYSGDGTYAPRVGYSVCSTGGTCIARLTVTKATVNVSLGSLSATYDGTPRAASATASTPVSGPLNVRFDYTYSSPTYPASPTPPTNAGSYTVTATVNDALYAGSATGTLTIAKAAATVTLGNLTQTYDGKAKNPAVTTNPPGLPVTFTYNGSSTAPTNVGTYAVVATINSPNASGSTTGTMVIGKATATIALSRLEQAYNGGGIAAKATTTPPGIALEITYDGRTTLPVNAGSYQVNAVVTDPNYTGSATGTLVIAKAAAAVVMADATVNYDGTPKSLQAKTTSPGGLPLAVTYDGQPAAPVYGGTYTVVATVTDPNYAGTATATLTIRAPVTFALNTGGADGLLGVILVDGVTIAPGTVYLTPGSHTLSVVTAPDPTGYRNLFTGWSDNGAQTHTINVPRGPSSLWFTAYLKQQIYVSVAAGPGGSVNPVTGWYDRNARVSATATPDPGYYFMAFKYSGAGVEYTNPLDFAVTKPVTITATFGQGYKVVTNVQLTSYNGSNANPAAVSSGGSFAPDTWTTHTTTLLDPVYYTFSNWSVTVQPAGAAYSIRMANGSIATSTLDIATALLSPTVTVSAGSGVTISLSANYAPKPAALNISSVADPQNQFWNDYLGYRITVQNVSPFTVPDVTITSITFSSSEVTLFPQFNTRLCPGPASCLVPPQSLGSLPRLESKSFNIQVQWLAKRLSTKMTIHYVANGVAGSTVLDISSR